MKASQGAPMNSSTSLVLTQRHLRRTTWLIVLVWTLAMAASMVWSARLLHNAMLDAAATTKAIGARWRATFKSTLKPPLPTASARIAPRSISRNWGRSAPTRNPMEPLDYQRHDHGCGRPSGEWGGSNSHYGPVTPPPGEGTRPASPAKPPSCRPGALTRRPYLAAK